MYWDFARASFRQCMWGLHARNEPQLQQFLTLHIPQCSHFWCSCQIKRLEFYVKKLTPSIFNGNYVILETHGSFIHKKWRLSLKSNWSCITLLFLHHKFASYDSSSWCIWKAEYHPFHTANSVLVFISETKLNSIQFSESCLIGHWIECKILIWEYLSYRI